MIKKLSEFEIGDKGLVKQILCNEVISRRMNDMGLIEGVEVELVRVAPFGDPIQIELRGYQLALRKHEAQNIITEVLLWSLH